MRRPPTAVPTPNRGEEPVGETTCAILEQVNDLRAARDYSHYD